MAKVESITRVVHGVSLPDGDWKGTWGGYVVNLRIGSEEYELRTDQGIRCPNAACVVHVDGSEVTVETVHGPDN